MVDSTSSVRLCVVLGGGGHARVVLDALRASRAAEAYIVLEANRARIGGDVDGVPIVGADDRLSEYVNDKHIAFVVGVGGVGDGRTRRRLFELGRAHGIRPLACVHPAAVCSPRATFGAGVQRLAGSIVGPGAALGVNCLINTGAIVEHECRVGDHVHVAIGARIAGGVTVGPNAHIGAGATILEGTHVGAGAIVGAGAVVISDVAEQVVVAGIPARVLRTVERREDEGRGAP